MADKKENVKTATPESVPQERMEANNIIKNNVIASMGLGIVPIFLFDFAAITAVQIRMLYKICKLYNIPFAEDRVRIILGSLLGGVMPMAFSLPLASLLKIIPVVGPMYAAASMPLIAGASTYAIGQTFVVHFEKGGTLFDFNGSKFKECFKEKFEEGKQVVTEAQKSTTKATA